MTPVLSIQQVHGVATRLQTLKETAAVEVLVGLGTERGGRQLFRVSDENTATAPEPQRDQTFELDRLA